MKEEHFVPPQLKSLSQDSNLIGMTLLSPNFFKFGLDLLRKIQIEVSSQPTNEFYGHSNNCFPAIIMFCVSFEAYINEIISRKIFLIKTNKKENFLSEIGELTKIRKEDRLKEKFKLFCKFFDKNNEIIKKDDQLLSELIAVFRLRNCIVHYSPDMIEMNKWPNRLREAFSKSKPSVLKSTWTTIFSNLKVVEWVYSTVKDGIIKFSQIAKLENPFDSNVPYPFNWDKEKEDK